MQFKGALMFSLDSPKFRCVPIALIPTTPPPAATTLTSLYVAHCLARAASSRVLHLLAIITSVCRVPGRGVCTHCVLERVPHDAQALPRYCPDGRTLVGLPVLWSRVSSSTDRARRVGARLFLSGLRATGRVHTHYRPKPVR